MRNENAETITAYANCSPLTSAHSFIHNGSNGSPYNITQHQAHHRIHTNTHTHMWIIWETTMANNTKYNPSTLPNETFLGFPHQLILFFALADAFQSLDCVVKNRMWIDVFCVRVFYYWLTNLHWKPWLIASNDWAYLDLFEVVIKVKHERVCAWAAFFFFFSFSRQCC